MPDRDPVILSARPWDPSSQQCHMHTLVLGLRPEV